MIFIYSSKDGEEGNEKEGGWELVDWMDNWKEGDGREKSESWVRGLGSV